MEITLKKLLNALFPKEDEDAQILNKKPVKVLGKLGPVIGLITILCLLLTQVFGGGINISQGFILFSLSLFIVVFLFFSKKLKQKKRNPVIFFLFILYASLMSLLGLKIASARQASWERINKEWEERSIANEIYSRKREEWWEALKQRQKDSYAEYKRKIQKIDEESRANSKKSVPLSFKSDRTSVPNNDVEEKVKTNDIDPAPFPSLVETFIQNQKKQKLEGNRIFKSSVLSKIALISDRDLMRREVFYTEKFPRNRRYVVGFEKILEEFFKAYEKESFVADYKDYEMTEEQSQLLCKFYGQSKAYLEKTSHGQYDRISKDPEWQEIQDLGKEVLRVCEYKKAYGL